MNKIYMAPMMLALVAMHCRRRDHHNYNMILTFTSYAVAMEEEVAMAANTEEMNSSFMMIGYLQVLINIMSTIEHNHWDE